MTQSTTDSNSQGLENLGFLTKKQVVELTTLSAPTIWRKYRAGSFPRPISISAGRVAWRESDIREWIASLTASTLSPAVKSPGRPQKKGRRS